MFTLIRDTFTDFCTMGTLFGSDGNRICRTLELPYRDNCRNVSSIPPGCYRICVVDCSKGRCIHVVGVPNRSGILIHSGNTPSDTRGCILVGKRSTIGKVFESRSAMLDVLDAYDKEPNRFITIKIK